ncbi:NAD(P)H-binding protein [Nocardia sp. NPDC058658]|uniref:NmrA family NAD(P)-binding protein n=1 Tax=Nocardia sp. NPDC058658 TaxID=3346580 RepID=UPI00365C3455
MSETVLITGATGTVGRHLVRDLAEAGVRPRAFVRDNTVAHNLFGHDAEIASGDLADPDAVRRAMTDVDTLFLACGNVAEQVALECAAIDAARSAGIRRVVKLSALGAAHDATPTLWRRHAAIEDHLAESGLSAVVLRPSFFMSNLFAAAAPVRNLRMLPAPAGTAPIAMIDPADIAAVATAVIMDDAVEPGTIELTGPESLTYHYVAQHLSDATGHDITYLDVAPDLAEQAMIADGLPEPMARQILEVFEALRHGTYATTNDQVTRLTGHPARTLAEFVADHASAFAEPVNR